MAGRVAQRSADCVGGIPPRLEDHPVAKAGLRLPGAAFPRPLAAPRTAWDWGPPAMRPSEVKELHGVVNGHESRLGAEQVRVQALEEARHIDVPGARRCGAGGQRPPDYCRASAKDSTNGSWRAGSALLGFQQSSGGQHRSERVAHQPARPPPALELARAAAPAQTPAAGGPAAGSGTPPPCAAPLAVHPSMRWLRCPFRSSHNCVSRALTHRGIRSGAGFAMAGELRVNEPAPLAKPVSPPQPAKDARQAGMREGQCHARQEHERVDLAGAGLGEQF